VSVTAGDFELRAKGRILKFDGYTRVLPQQSKPGEDDVLPEMKEGENLKLIKLDPSQHFTKPPARYSEASLVK
ncbi:DNA topoisomerase, partial [Acinetobacter baumannii]